jgi:hypothetical protein
MVKIFNVILIVSVLVALYFCIQKNNDDQQTISSESNKNNKQITENFNTDKIFFNETEPIKKIQFNYGKLRPIDKQFLKEQELGVNQNTWYPNTWIDHIDEATGEPVYGSRENPNVENFIESKARFSYEFNSPRSVQMDGVVDPSDFKNNQGITIQEIYNNSFVDYKKLVPEKKKVDLIDKGIIPSKNAGSNLSFIEPDNWVYENEKPENGGRFDNGVFASDPYSANSISNSHAVF